MTRTEYIEILRQNLDDAVVVPFQKVSLDGQTPAIAKCHQNVNTSVQHNQGYEAVHGWIYYKDAVVDNITYQEFTAHTVMRSTGDGQVFDITPLANESERGERRFLEHVGDEQYFFDLVGEHNSVYFPYSEEELQQKYEALCAHWQQGDQESVSSWPCQAEQDLQIDE